MDIKIEKLDYDQNARNYHMAHEITDEVVAEIGKLDGVEPDPEYKHSPRYLYEIRVHKGHLFDWGKVEPAVLAVLEKAEAAASQEGGI